jgi:hypothetical protein
LHSDVEPSREGVDVNAADHRAELSDAVLFAGRSLGNSSSMLLAACPDRQMTKERGLRHSVPRSSRCQVFDRVGFGVPPAHAVSRE